MTPDQLRQDLVLAHATAEKAIQGVSDGGSCSLDCVYIPSGKRHPIKRRTIAYDQAIEAAGFSGHRSDSSWWKGYIITPNAGGQASTRLAACEAMAKVLCEQGWGACVYYMRD